MSDERRLVAILFADVVGSTALSDGLDPEDTRALMTCYFEHAQSVARDHGGILEKFIGDAVLIIFGIPVAHRDDGERALAAAMDLRRDVEQDPVLPEKFRLRTGVHIGEVVASSNPGDVFIASGDSMNVAARLEQNAEAGQILVSDRLAAATWDAFEFGPAVQLEVSGKATGLRTRELLCRRAIRRVRRPSFVGRQAEIAKIRDLFDSGGGVILGAVMGASGTGKSRLLEEVLERAVADGIIVIRAAARSPRSGTAEVHRNLIESLVGEGAGETAISDFLRSGGMEQTSADRVAGVLASNAGISLGGQVHHADAETVVRAWRSLVTSVASGARVVVALDDCHGVSDDTWNILRGLAAARLTDGTVVILVTARQDLLHPQRAVDLTADTTMQLAGLDASDCTGIVRSYVPGITSADLQTIVSRCEGNPFYLLELLALFLRRTSLPDESRLAWPDTVHSLVAERLDGLSEPQKNVVSMLAAACGPLRLTALGLVDGNYASAQLEQLLATDLVKVQDGTVDIAQALVRDIAYSSMSRAERVRRHVRLAQILWDADDELLGVAAAADQLRFANEQARGAVVPQRIAVSGKLVIGTLGLAASRAWRNGNAAEAELFINTGLDMSAGDEHRAFFLELLGDVGGWSPAAVSAFEDLTSLAQGTPEASHALLAAVLRGHRKALVVLTRGGQLGWMGRKTESLLEHLSKARSLAVRLEDDVEETVLQLITYFFPDELEPDPGRPRSLEMARAAVGQLEGRVDAETMSLALDACQQAAISESKLDTALEIALARLAMPDLPVTERADAVSMGALAWWSLGNADEAIALVLDEARGLDPTRSVLALAGALSTAITVAYQSGHWSAARELAPYLLAALEEGRQGDQDLGLCLNGFFGLLWIAVAECDELSVARYNDSVAQCLTEDGAWGAALRIVTAFGTGEIDDVPDLTSDQLGNSAPSLLTLLNERGRTASGRLVQAAADSGERMARPVAVATAIAARDTAALDDLVQLLSEGGMSVLAARLAVVSAEIRHDQEALRACAARLTAAGDLYFAERARSAADREG